MESTFLGIEIGKRSLISHNKGLNVIGQNLSNADNPAYSRQRVILNSIEPLYRPDLTRPERAGRIGQGIEVSQVRRERDIYLDVRIQKEISQKSYWDQSQLNLSDIENIQNALSSGNFQSKFDIFWKSWQELAQNPSEPALRQELLQNSLNLTESFRSHNTKFNNLRYELNDKIIAEVDQINSLVVQIAKFNRQIRNSQILGDNPNDLLDKRDFMVEQLAEKIDATVSFNDEDEFMVHSGPRILIQGHKYQTLDMENDPENGGMMKLLWSNTRDDFTTQKGSLAAYIESRDQLLPREIRNLDVMAVNLVFAVNDIHRQGFNYYGKVTGDFFTSVPYSPDASGVGDSNSDGILDSTLIYQIVGGEKLNGQKIVGSSGTISLATGDPQAPGTTTVDYYLTDTIDKVIERLNNAQNSLNFKLDYEGKLMVKTRSNENPYPFSLEYLEDSGGFLSGIAKVLNASNVVYTATSTTAIDSLHPDASFYRSPIQSISAYIDINSYIKEDSNLIATREAIDLGTIENTGEVNLVPKGIQDGTIAQKISEVRYKHTLLDSKKTFDEFYINAVTQVSTELSHAKMEVERYDVIALGLKDLRQSISGINIDEELTQMIVFQNGYQAGARIVKMMDEVLDIIMEL